MSTYQEIRQKLLENETEAEKIFEKMLQRLKIRYTKQKVIFYGKSFYIADFFLEENGFLIEIDGEYHFLKHQLRRDKKRDEKIKKFGGYKILRFTNEEIELGGKWIEDAIVKGFKDWN